MTKQVVDALHIINEAIGSQINLTEHPRIVTLEKIACALPELVSKDLLTTDEATMVAQRIVTIVDTLPIGTP